MSAPRSHPATLEPTPRESGLLPSEVFCVSEIELKPNELFEGIGALEARCRPGPLEYRL